MGNIIIYSQSKARSIENTTTSDGHFIPYQIGDGKYMKTGLAKSPNGYVVVKAFQVPVDGINIKEHEKYLNFVNSQIDPIKQPNLAPFTRYYFDERTRTAYMIRPYFHSCLYSRLNSRPFPAPIEQLWIVYQCLQALAQLHSVKLTHGDIKPENFVVTSWGWVYLTDFGFYKPAQLSLEDNIFTYFNYFFAKQKQHSCYLAPERIVQHALDTETKPTYPQEYNSYSIPPDQPCSLHWSSDIFSLGCVIAEIFTEGQEVFDLSNLLHYCNDDDFELTVLNRIEDKTIRSMVQTMISKNDRNRLSAEEYLNRYTNDIQLFPPLFRDVLYPLFSECMKPENCTSDMRILLILKHYTEIMHDMLGVSNYAREEKYAYYTAILESILINTEPEQPSDTHVSCIPESLCSDDYKQRLLELQHGIEALQTKIEQSSAIPKGDDQLMKTPTPLEETMHIEEDTKDSKVKAQWKGEECILVLIPLLTSSLRSVKFAVSKMIAMSFLCDITKYVSDDVIIQRILPYFVSVLTEASDNNSGKIEYASVLSMAVRCITTILTNIHTLPHSDFNIVSDYIIPAIMTIQQNEDYQVQLTIAECLSSIALSGKRLLNVAQKAKMEEALMQCYDDDDIENICVENGYREDMSRLREGVKMMLSFAMCDDDELPAIACTYIQHMDDYFKFFGYKLFFSEIVSIFLGKLNSTSLYVKFLAIDLFTLLYRRSSNGLQAFTETIVNSVYNRHHLVMLKVLSVFVALLEDKQNVLPKETAEDIIMAIRPLLLHPNPAIRDKIVDCLLLMERVYPKPTTQAMMIRLIQDYYDCPVFYLPWTKEALTVHLHAPLDEQQLADAELAEITEKMEKDRGSSSVSNTAESLYLDFDMGTDLVKPDVFTKQMYMRSFLRQMIELDKTALAAFSTRTRGNTTYEEALSQRARSRGSSMGSQIESAKIQSEVVVNEKPAKNINNYSPEGVLIREFTPSFDSSINKLGIAPNSSVVYWGNNDGMIGYYDTRKVMEPDYQGIVITQTTAGISNMHICDDNHHLLYSSNDGLISLLNIETRSNDSFSQTTEFSQAEHSIITTTGSSTSPYASCFFYSALNQVHIYDIRTKAPVHSITLNSSLGAISSLAYDGNSDILILGTTRGYIPVYNMSYPLLVNLWQQSDASAITQMKLGQDITSSPTVWTASGNNRVCLWNIRDGECKKCITANITDNNNITLNPIPVRGIDEVLGTSLVNKQNQNYQHHINAMLLPPTLTTNPDYAAGYLLTAGSDRCVRYWSFEENKSSYTVCGLGQDDHNDVYYHDHEKYYCKHEKTVLGSVPRTNEVKPSHAMEITDMIIAGETREEVFVTSCADGKLRVWK